MITTFNTHNFNLGVVLSIPPDELPDGASPRMYNTRLAPQAGGGFGVQNRPGLINFATHTSTQTINGLTNYRYLSTAGVTEYIIAVNSSGVINNIPAVTGTPTLVEQTINFAGTTQVTTVSNAPGIKWQFAQANNAIYGCCGAPADSSSLATIAIYRTTSSATVKSYPWGLSSLASSLTLTTSGGGSSAAGTYDLYATFYNANTGTEGATIYGTTFYQSIALNTNDALNVRNELINGSAFKPGATHWNLYVRRRENMSEFFRDDVMRFSYAIASSTTTLSFTLARLANMVLKAPPTGTNGLPPQYATNLCLHQSRMFVTDGDYLYYSDINKPESFANENYETIGFQDGQKITHMISLDTSNMLVLKSRSMYMLSGTSPHNWQIEKIPTSYGCVAPGAACLANNTVFSWSHQGPVKWTIGGEVEPLFNEVVLPLTRAGAIQTETATPNVYFDSLEQRVLFTVGTSGTLARWTVMPYNLVHDCWEAIGWDLPGTPIMCDFRDQSGDARETEVLMGFSGGVIGRLSRNVATDMAQNVTGANLHFTAQGVNTTTLTYSYTSASLPPVSTTLTSKVVVIDSNTLLTHRSSYTITTSSTSTHTLTLTTAMNSTAGANSTVVFDMPVAELDTRPQRSEGAVRRFVKLWADMTATADVKTWFGVFLNNAVNANKVWHASIRTAQPTEGVTEGTTISGALRLFKSHLGLRGLRMRARIVMYYPVKSALTALGWTSYDQGQNR